MDEAMEVKGQVCTHTVVGVRQMTNSMKKGIDIDGGDEVDFR